MHLKNTNMKELSSFEFITLCISGLSGLVMFAYKFPKAYKSLGLVKSFLHMWFVGSGACLVWNFSAKLMNSKLQVFLIKDSVDKSKEILKTFTVSINEYLLFSSVWLVIILSLWLLGDVHSILKKDTSKQENQ